MARMRWDGAWWTAVALVPLCLLFSGSVRIPATPPLTDAAMHQRSVMGACMMNVDPIRLGCDWHQARAWDERGSVRDGD